MPRFSVRAETIGQDSVFHLAGNFVSGAADLLRSATKWAGKSIVFDWSGVTITSSDGIREWVGFLDEVAPGRAVALAQCPPNIVISFNMIPACIGPAKVASVYGTFVCPGCNKERSDVLVTAADVSDRGELKKPVICESCGDLMALNLPPDEYFGFWME
jgi:hypothetical protein